MMDKEKFNTLSETDKQWALYEGIQENKKLLENNNSSINGVMLYGFIAFFMLAGMEISSMFRERGIKKEIQDLKKQIQTPAETQPVHMPNAADPNDVVSPTVYHLTI